MNPFKATVVFKVDSGLNEKAEAIVLKVERDMITAVVIDPKSKSKGKILTFAPNNVTLDDSQIANLRL